jgi:hypothetical protein
MRGKQFDPTAAEVFLGAAKSLSESELAVYL